MENTERIEITPDTNEKSLEQSVEELKNDGVDVNKDTTQSSDGTGVKINEVPKETQPTEDRPNWLPKKFKNAEELARAYGELEKQYSSRPKNEVKDDVKIPEPSKEPEGKRVQTLEKFYDEYAEKGSLTEDSYKELAKQGLTRDLVDGYIEGQKSLADNHTKTIHDTVGGKERYGELIDWASKNLTEAEQNTFNNLVDGGTLDEAKFAVSGLMMKAGMNFNPKQPELFEGTSDVTPTDAYESVSQVTDAMNDPRYEKDPSYRKKVADKLARSSVM
ncbi:scaffolding protein [uncultured phage_Deep-GF0-KM16-C193]|uniref:Scaffolding protein n=1 Tax=uncultured phage_Deep-GF0-KM16-C193 TaxID=2740799 RepID=A0A1B1IWQ1_9CAUD|nr:head assembly [uncultured phage_Deep-GF0-KM16-C193]ANS05744.1 scaffolding protein [uncultured phage_Deep-GF0-KM16-C193]